MTARPMVKMIHADGFFPAGDTERCVAVVKNVPFTEKSYGYELENFNMVLSGVEPILSKVLGERVVVEHKRSGIFRRPFNNIIHFEDFNSLNEWCFIVALEPNTLNLYHHKDDQGYIDAKTALDSWDHNYRNLFEWELHTNVLLEANQGVFIRPWVFHSLDSNLVQYYRLFTDRHFRVLVVGDGTHRKEFSQELVKHIEGSKLLDSWDTRTVHKDVDFTETGLLRNTHRVLTIARNGTAETPVTVIDMRAPLQAQRSIINADVLLWVDTGDSEYKQMDFEIPPFYDARITSVNTTEINKVIEIIKTKRIANE
jgi:hypothetical protein